MSTIIELKYVTILLSRINNFNQDHQQGWSSIPHMCIKVKHGNGFAWFGLNIVKYDNVIWNQTMRSNVINEITKSLTTLTDVEEIASDMDRTIDSILEIVNEKKTNLLLSNKKVTESPLDIYVLRNEHVEERDIILSMNLSNSVTLEVYNNLVDFDSLSYGGFALEISTENGSFPAMLFHRSIVVNNYIDSETVEKVVKHALEGYLSSLTNVKLNVRVIKIVERNRTRPAK